MPGKLYAVTFPETGPMRVRFSRWWPGSVWAGFIMGLGTWVRCRPVRITTVWFGDWALDANNAADLRRWIQRDPEDFRRAIGQLAEFEREVRGG